MDGFEDGEGVVRGCVDFDAFKVQGHVHLRRAGVEIVFGGWLVELGVVRVFRGWYQGMVTPADRGGLSVVGYQSMMRALR